jgi:hypothetical protein
MQRHVKTLQAGNTKLEKNMQVMLNQLCERILESLSVSDEPAETAKNLLSATTSRVPAISRQLSTGTELQNATTKVDLANAVLDLIALSRMKPGQLVGEEQRKLIDALLAVLSNLSVNNSNNDSARESSRASTRTALEKEFRDLISGLKSLHASSPARGTDALAINIPQGIKLAPGTCNE